MHHLYLKTGEVLEEKTSLVCVDMEQPISGILVSVAEGPAGVSSGSASLTPTVQTC